jgi:multidrug resistance protein
MNRSPLFVIFVTVFIDLVGFGIVIPILPYYVESFGGTPRQQGMLLTSYSVMQLIFSPILGRMSDRYGRRPVLFLSLVGSGVGFLIMGFAGSLWMLFAGRILAGITGGNISTAQAYIADVTTPENRAKGMGMFGAAFGLGFIFGPAIGGIMSRWGIHVPVVFAGALALANAVLLYFTLPETITADHPARTTVRGWGHFFQQLRRRPLALVIVVYFLFVVSFSIMTTTFIYYTILRYDYDAQHNGYLFAYIGVLAAIVQGLLIGRLVKRWGGGVARHRGRAGADGEPGGAALRGASRSGLVWRAVGTARPARLLLARQLSGDAEPVESGVEIRGRGRAGRRARRDAVGGESGARHRPLPRRSAHLQQRRPARLRRPHDLRHLLGGGRDHVRRAPLVAPPAPHQRARRRPRGLNKFFNPIESMKGA